MKIYVGNLSRDVRDEDLLKAFEAFGNVESATVVKDKFTGETRGFGFVEMASATEAQAAIDGMNGTELMGRAVNVNEARPREDRFGGGRPGGGRPGGNRFGGRPGGRPGGGGGRPGGRPGGGGGRY
jgi:RNA recognition motif-containing protein